MSNSCGHAIDYIYNYLDEEITWTRRMRVRWHLRKCNHCTDAYEFETQLKAVVRSRGHDDAPPELVDRLRTLIQEQRGQQQPND